MSEITPTFVNWDETASQPAGPGGQFIRGRPSPPATDLHIEFAEGGVTVTNKGSEASEFAYGNDQRNSVDIYFPRDKPLESQRYEQPAEVNANGGIDPPGAKTPAPGTFAKPTFTHNKPNFPAITRWWWTYRKPNGTGAGKARLGNPEADPPRDRPKRPRR